MTSNNFVLHDIDLLDDFRLKNIIEKACNHLYRSLDECATDLSKICRMVTKSTNLFILKEYNGIYRTYQIGWVSFTTMKSQLSAIKILPKTNSDTKMYTVWDALYEFLDKLTIDDVCFNNDRPDVFNHFHGFKYPIVETVDLSIIAPYLQLVQEVICNHDMNLYRYILSWMSYIVQNPGKKTGTCLILQGAQGIGKNQFTDTFSDLLGVYAAPNINNIDEISGQFNSVIEGKMLIVCNEMRNVGNSRLANFDALKSVITDPIIRINEKCQPRRDAENVSNLIIITNNSFPVKIENGDRRYVVCLCNGVHKNDHAYWNDFVKMKTPVFYQHLLTYLLNFDINDFNPRMIPMTEAKRNIQEASTGKFGRWINLHYNQLTTDGIRLKDIWLLKPDDIPMETYKIEIATKLSKNSRMPASIDPKRPYVYKLKPEYTEGHHQVDWRGIDENENSE